MTTANTIIENVYSPKYGRFYYTPEGNKVLAYTYGEGEFKAVDDTAYHVKVESKKFARKETLARFKFYFIAFIMTHLYALMFMTPSYGLSTSFFIGGATLLLFARIYYMKKKGNYELTYSQALIDIGHMQGNL